MVSLVINQCQHVIGSRVRVTMAGAKRSPPPYQTLVIRPVDSKSYPVITNSPRKTYLDSYIGCLNCKKTHTCIDSEDLHDMFMSKGVTF